MNRKTKLLLIATMLISMNATAQTSAAEAVVKGVFSLIGIPTRPTYQQQQELHRKQQEAAEAAKKAEVEQKNAKQAAIQAQLDTYKSQGWMYATDNTNKDLFFVNGEDLRADKDTVTAWVKTQMSKPIFWGKKSVRSSITLVEYDCKARTIKNIEETFYSGNSGNKSVVISDDEIDYYDYSTNRVIPDTAGSRLLNFVCGLREPATPI